MKSNFLKRKILGIKREYKVLVLILNDLTFLLIALALSYYLLSDVSNVETKLSYYSFSICIAGILIFYFSGIYRIVLRFINLSSIVQVFKAVSVYSLISSIYFMLIIPEKPFQLALLNWFISVLSILFSRLFFSYLLSDILSSSKVLIYGAGSAGIQLANALKYSRELKPVAFIDEEKDLQGTLVAGLKVHPHSELKKVIEKKGIDEVLIAIPSAKRIVLKKLLEDIESLQVKVRVLPGVAELAQGKVLISELKEVDIEDLLGREKVEPDQNLLDKNIKNKAVLVTGGGGSIGSEICRQVTLNSPKALVILDSNEFRLYSLKQELDKLGKDINIHPILGNVTNQKRIEEVCKVFNIETVYHAAAYKHVPIVEANPFEGIFNNVFGTLRCLKAAISSGVKTFVLISTDKAVRPTNIMGATKRLSELVLQAIANDKSLKDKTDITMVRFGNVLGSSGSAIPLFQEQIRNGGPITVTDPEVIRYFMTISEAAELVIQAGALGKGGDVFVLDMGKPVKIMELAEKMIRLSGMEVKDENNPEGEIEISFTGLRPGEKLYEELLIGENILSTSHKQIFRATEDFLPWQELNVFLERLKEAERTSDQHQLRKILQEVVSGFQPKSGIVDVLFLIRERKI